jgi:hypothetical protein
VKYLFTRLAIVNKTVVNNAPKIGINIEILLLISLETPSFFYYSPLVSEVMFGFDWLSIPKHTAKNIMPK